MSEKIKKAVSEALKEISEESVNEGILAGALSMLLKGGRNQGFFLMTFDLDDPANGDRRKTAYHGEADKMAMALGLEMIDDDDVRYILNNAKATLDLFNEDLPEEEKLK